MDADGSSSRARPLRIIIFPWLGFGHMLPSLELAERLAERGHHVSFVSPPGNLARLPPLRAPAGAAGVELVPLELPRVPGLPEGAESTNDAPDLAVLKQAFDGLAAPFDAFLAARCAAHVDDGGAKKPDWVVLHPFNDWGADAALKHGVRCLMILPSAPFVTAMGCGARDRAELTAASVFEQFAAAAEEGRPPPAGMPRYEWEWNKRIYGPRRTPGLSIAQRCSSTLEKCTITAIRGCPEWEPEDIPLVAALLGKPVVPLGLLPPSPDGDRTTSAYGVDDATLRWLDEQPAKSVLYVALGSQVPLSVQQVHELALGLDLAGTRFLWALRKPSGSEGVSNANVLPAGFQERTDGRGQVTMKWVPQSAILSHATVGAFLTHCGHSSLVEGLQHGHPLVMLPIFADQGPNARLMERRKVGLPVPRDDDDGSFDRHGVASAVRAVMVEEDSRRVFVENARKMQDIVADKELQERYIDEFIQQLRSYADGGN